MAAVNEHDFPPLPSQGAKRQPGKRALVENTNKRSKQGSNASMNDLPDELILHIIDYLLAIDIPDSQLPTLLNLALASRRLHRIVIEKIYENFDSRFTDPYMFLRTIISNPQLADLVQDVSIDFAGSIRSRYHRTARDKKIVKEGLRALATPGWKDWATECNETKKCDDAVYKAILCFTRNIRSLQLEARNTDAPSRSAAWFEIFSKTASGILSDQAHGFQQLRSVTIDGTSATPIQLASLFQLESLQTLKLRDINNSMSEYAVSFNLKRLLPQASSNLENLYLKGNFYPESILNIFLASPRQLKYFEYHPTSVNDEYTDPQDETPVSLCQVLTHQKKSLQTVDVYQVDPEYELAELEIHLHDSLEEFSALRCLTCPLGMIASSDSDTFVERLPSSLLTFRTHIREFMDDGDCIGALEHMVANHQSHTPQLQEIIVYIPHVLMYQLHHLKRSIEISSTVGLSFKVECGRYGRDDEFSSMGEDLSVSSSTSDEVNLYSDDE